MMGACQRTQDQVRSKSGHFGTKITEPWKKWQPQVLIKSQHVSGGGSCYGGVVCGTVAHSGGRGRCRAEKHSKHTSPGPRLEDRTNHHPNRGARETVGGCSPPRIYGSQQMGTKPTTHRMGTQGPLPSLPHHCSLESNLRRTVDTRASLGAAILHVFSPRSGNALVWGDLTRPRFGNGT